MRYVGRAARMQRRHERNKQGIGLNLVPMIDMFTILVFFLLVNSGDVQVLPNVRNVQLPESTADEHARQTVVVLITNEQVLVQGRPVAQVADLLAGDELIIPELETALETETERALREETREDAARREVTIMGDKSIPYRLLKKIMATCTDADYGRVSFAVLHKSVVPALAAARGA